MFFFFLYPPSFGIAPCVGTADGRRIKALLLRPKTTTAAPVSAPLRQPLQQATAAAAIDGRNRKICSLRPATAAAAIDEKKTPQ